jgi:hypothetical protein
MTGREIIAWIKTLDAEDKEFIMFSGRELAPYTNNLKFYEGYFLKNHWSFNEGSFVSKFMTNDIKESEDPLQKRVSKCVIITHGS